ncbi:hypothetical protein AQ505_19320 [Pedobacter sp. PACM 27299]|uniref:hypothetical protein n=1 Tax=Pedobacter sp. PACM 27299 TaxID=1727164 RepID=UPI0007057C9C|nr:hypothetical protein [Pedobacter sp. PACM 27299]ALL07451.1 hypothetical protein AQ505_19320 [Pedobacter sp. PACM 27299]
MRLNRKQSHRLNLLVRSFLKDYPPEEVWDVLYQLYRSWAYQVSIKTNRQERLRVLTCYSDLKELLGNMEKLKDP